MVISCEIFHLIHFVPRSSIILTLSNIWLYTLQNTKSIEIARELVRNWIEISFPVPVPLTPLYNYSKKCFKGLWQLAAHTETSQLISFVSQLPGFYMIWTIEGLSQFLWHSKVAYKNSRPTFLLVEMLNRFRATGLFLTPPKSLIKPEIFGSFQGV